MVNGKVLELGTGKKPAVDADVHHDLMKHSEHIDIAHDLNITPWPFESGEYRKIYAVDVFEHLKPWLIDIHQWLGECHRILKPGGRLCFRVPNWNSKDAYTNPTHYRSYTDETFDFWDLSTVWGNEYGRWMYEKYNQWWTVLYNRVEAGQINIIMEKSEWQPLISGVELTPSRERPTLIG